jgi:5S rRNA maturation endonuclease (ribonuclease M5)
LQEIKDVREKKRKEIIERAAELLKEWDQKSLDASEIEEQIDTDIKLGEIITWGPDDLPAGPDIEESDEIILVEGRADVLNLLRIGIKNTIAVQGTSVPQSIVDLAKSKEVTVFLDGDRGGDLILKELSQLIDIDHIARAPEGYEVEELTRKQLIKYLQKKRSITSYKSEEEQKEVESTYSSQEKVLIGFLDKLKVKQKDIIIDKIKEIEMGNAVGYDKKLNQLFTIPVSELYNSINEYENTKYLILDGILTERLLNQLLTMDIKFIACKNKETDLKVPNNITVYYF